MSKHTQGQDCTCAARSQHECACDADWTSAEVYELRAKVKDLEHQNEELKYLIKEADEYLDINDLTSIHHGCILHRKFKYALT